MKAYTTRFESYCAFLGKPAEEVKAGHEFMNWIGRQWAEFNRTHEFVKGDHHAAFDRWLSAKYGVPA